MKNKGLIATIVVMSAVIITLVVVLLVMQMSSIVPLSELTKKTTESIVETSSSEVQLETTETTKIVEEDKVKADIKTYSSHNGRINIEYPEVKGLNSTEMQDKVNSKLYSNAISIVKLYPISTSLQKLNITCSVKSINNDYITVLYEGQVIGDKASGNNVNLKGGSAPVANTQKSSPKANAVDPYLDGFVDPFPYNNYVAPTTATEPPTVTYNNNAVSKTPVDDKKTGTADTGPSVSIITKPTAPNQQGVVSSNTIVNGEYSSNSVYNTPNRSGSNLPIDANQGSGSANAPVYGHTGTSVSASTINHKIFYTNVIDLKTGMDLSLKDYISDFNGLAKYARSNDVEFVNIDEKNRTEVRSYIRKTVQSTLATYLEKNSDFRNEGIKAWPKHFSYKDEDGTIYFTIKLSSKLGNYAIIKYKK